MFEKRINIFTGHFGSGKTEVSVNYAMSMSEAGHKTAIMDFDIVNPYFRTTDAKKELEKNNIRVITPVYANTNVDVPALPGEVNILFEQKAYKVVLDIGGDDLGAKVLARYREEIVNDDFEMFFVINSKRPMTDTVEKTIAMIKEIESSSGLKVSKLINNTNLLQNTKPVDIIEGHRMIEKVSGMLNIPIAFISGFGKEVQAAGDKLNVETFFLSKHINLPF